MKKCSGIYAIKCVPTGKLYVGSAANCFSRNRVHRQKLELGKHVNRYLQAAWGKHGADAFVFEMLEECLVGELKQREQFWINKTRSGENKFGFNLAPAMRQDMPAEQLSAIMRNYWEGLSEEERARRHAYKHTKEGRALLQQNAIKQWNDPEFRNTMPVKVSSAMKKLCALPEATKRLTAVSRLYWADKGAKAKMSKRMLKQWANLYGAAKGARLKGFKPRETTRFLTLKNTTKSLKEWSQESGLPYGLLLRRVTGGVIGEDAFLASYKHKPEDSFVHRWLHRETNYGAVGVKMLRN